MYLIAEIGVGSLFINFIKSPDIGNMTAADAGHYLTLFMGRHDGGPLPRRRLDDLH